MFYKVAIAVILTITSLTALSSTEECHRRAEELLRSKDQIQRESEELDSREARLRVLDSLNEIRRNTLRNLPYRDRAMESAFNQDIQNYNAEANNVNAANARLNRAIEAHEARRKAFNRDCRGITE